ncbi:putative hemagglutinin-related protein [Streptococcus oralis]|uniref:Putative hemagglutinin-related protein n=1 Tax=Streptococcus oralis TaxID=1303 RepID=A0A139NZM5_STROR|nr:putative hemagglutinin-related protein [Streptococcus oralis]
MELGGKTVDSTLIEQRLKDFAEGTLEFQDVLDDYSEVYARAVKSNQTWSWREDIPFGLELTNTQRKLVKEAAIENGLLTEVKVIPADGMKYGFADFSSAGLVEETVNLPEELWLKTDKEQFEWLNNKIGGFREGMTWHHTEIPGKMELVPFGIHNITPHNGGRTVGMWAYAPR